MPTELSLEQEQQALAIAEQAWALPSVERKAFVTQACQYQAELILYIEELMCESIGEEFLNPNTLFQSQRQQPHTTTRPNEWEGKTLGPYKITEGIARGGMGDVYLAQRSDGAFDKRVAIKFIRRDLGIDVEQRFANERNILARLQHPSIAQLFDGGTSNDGHSYYVMEYVEGLRIDHYCQNQKLNSQQILKLIIKVGKALSAAHAQLIIHRDLKPDNILVTPEGEPKLLDFGIAKVLQSHKTSEQSDNTTINPLTPRYASPEQLRQENLGPTTDIYSLGVILYELLTGVSPYGEEISSPFVYSQKVLENSPTRPSKLIARNQSIKNVGLRERIGLSWFKQKLVVLWSGLALDALDLDPVLLKALAKTPAHRYASVQQFNDDLQAYLSGNPVSARSPSWTYRGKKFLLRHKLAMTAASLIVVIGTYAVLNNYKHLKAIETQYLLLTSQQQQIAEQSRQVTAQQQELQRQEQVLVQEQQRITAINQEILAKNQLINEQRDDQISTAQQLTNLDSENEGLKQQVEQLAESTARRTERLYDSIQQYLNLLNRQYWPDKNQALETLLQQQRDIERVFAANMQRKVDLLLSIVELYQALDFYQQAQDLGDAVVAELSKQGGKHPDLGRRALFLQAKTQEYFGNQVQSEALYRQALAGQPDNNLMAFQSQISLAQFLIADDKLQQAEAQLSEVKQTLAVAAPNSNQPLSFPRTMGKLLRAKHQPEAAIDIYEKTLLRAEDKWMPLDGDFIDRIHLLIEWADIKQEQSNTSSALAILDQAEAALRSKIGWTTSLMAYIEIKKAGLHLFQQTDTADEKQLISAMQLLTNNLELKHAWTTEAVLYLAQLQTQDGQYSAALQTLNPIVANATPGSALYANLLSERGKIYYALERYQDAHQSLQEAKQHPRAKNTADVDIALSKTLIQLGLFEQANLLLKQLEELPADATNLNSITKIGTFTARGLYWELQGDHKNTLDYYVQALASARTQLASEHPLIAVLQLDQGRGLFYRDRYRPAKRDIQQALQSFEGRYRPDHPQIVLALQHLSVLEAVLDSSGRFSAAKTYHQQALNMEGLNEENSRAIAGCYGDMATVVSFRHSYLLDYWLLQSDLFLAMAHNWQSYDNINQGPGTFTNNNRANRQAISCFENLLENFELTEERRAILSSQLGVLKLTVKEEESAKRAIAIGLDHFKNEFGINHPRVRFLEMVLASSSEN